MGFGIFGNLECKEWVREATEVGTTHLGALGGLACAGGLCPPRGTPEVQLWPIGFLFVHKKSPWSFVAFGLHLALISSGVKKKKKNNNWHWALVQ